MKIDEVTSANVLYVLKSKDKYKNRLSPDMNIDAVLSKKHFQFLLKDRLSIKNYIHEVSSDPFGFSLLCAEQVSDSILINK
jgi:hypothetical protein